MKSSCKAIVILSVTAMALGVYGLLPASRGSLPFYLHRQLGNSVMQMHQQQPFRVSVPLSCRIQKPNVANAKQGSNGTRSPNCTRQHKQNQCTG